MVSLNDLVAFVIHVLDEIVYFLQYGDLFGAVSGVIVWLSTKLGLNWQHSDWFVIGLAFLIMAAFILVVILTVAPGFLWVMRKIMAHIQSRMGPMYVGPHGLMQPVADGLKLVMKEDIIPARADPFAFRIAPYVVLVPVIIAFAPLPFGNGIVLSNVTTGILFILAISAVSPLGEILAGWSSNNKFAMYGGLRAAALDVSYEIPMILSAIAVVLLVGDLSTQAIVTAQSGVWFALLLPLGVAIFFASALAKIGVVPLDLPEAESELVAGYFTEYSGIRFGVFMLTVFANIFLIAALTVTLFFGGWIPLKLFPDTIPNDLFSGVIVVGLVQVLFALLLTHWRGSRAMTLGGVGVGLAGFSLVFAPINAALQAGGVGRVVGTYWIFGNADWVAIGITVLGLALVALSGLLFLRSTKDLLNAGGLTLFPLLAPAMSVPIGSFLVKSLFFSFLVFWIWFTLPRVRPDQFLRIGWKVFFPISLVNLVLAGVWKSAPVEVAVAATGLSLLVVLAITGRPRRRTRARPLPATATVSAVQEASR